MTEDDPAENKFHHLVAEMRGGVGWRDLRTGDTARRSPAREVTITGVEHVAVAGNFPWNFVFVATDAGVTGVGEAFTGPVGEYVEFLEPGLVGENPLDVARLAEHATQLVSGLGGTQGYSQAAVSGVEAALWDVAGKLLDAPVYQLLGGTFRDDVRIYADCHAGSALEEMDTADETTYDPAAYATVAREVVEEGFTALKFDLDVRTEDADTAARRLSGPAIEHKARIVEAVTEAVPDDVLVGFDCHWNFSVETAVELARAVEPYDVGFLEDPVPPDSADSHRRVTERTTTPILTGENRTRLEGFLPFLVEGAVDFVAPDLQKCGGLREFQEIAAVAEATGVPVLPHNIASPVGTLASVHACASVPNAVALEFHAREVDWWDDLHRGDPLIDDGSVAVPEAPGLGVDLDLDVVADNLAAGEELPDAVDDL
jgi:L-alanine-DL-glutamate epimerase-like enolase superfamily enzyme